MRSAIETPTPDEAQEAKAALRLITGDSEDQRRSAAKVSLKIGDLEVSIPFAAFEILTDVLAELANGNAVTVVPHHAELTTQEAADILNVSRPHLVQQLEAGAIPYHKVGTHRRIKMSDLMAYRKKSRELSRAALQELADQAQELEQCY